MRSLMIAIVLLSACGKNSEPPPPSSGSPSAQPESGPSRPRTGTASPAQQMYAATCAMCHGADGTGKGPAAAMLNPKPRDYTDPAWQASVTDDQLKDTILKGGQAVGKSPSMAGYPGLATQPDVLEGLITIIRGFGKHP